MPQLAVSALSVLRSSSLILPRSRLADLSVMRADDVAQRGAGQVDDLVLVVGDVVLARLDVLLVGLDLEVDLRVDARVEVVVGDDGLRLGLDQHLADVDLEHALDARDDDVEARVGVAVVLAEALDEAAMRRAHDADAHGDQHQQHDDDDEDDCTCDHADPLS